MLSFLCLHAVMTSWRDVMTSQNSFLPISACRCSKMRIQMYFCRYFGWWVPNYHRVCTCMMFLCHDMTSLKLLHDVRKRTAFISTCKCAWELITFSFLWLLWWLNYNLIIVFVFAWWNNVTKWRHDVIKHAVPISACKRVREMILFFVSIVFWVAKFKIIIDFVFSYVVMSQSDAMTSWHDYMTSQNSLHLY